MTVLSLRWALPIVAGDRAYVRWDFGGLTDYALEQLVGRPIVVDSGPVGAGVVEGTVAAVRRVPARPTLVALELLVGRVKR